MGSQFRDLKSIFSMRKGAYLKFSLKKADCYQKNIRSDTLGLKGLIAKTEEENKLEDSDKGLN